jgi:lysozyme family protein
VTNRFDICINFVLQHECKYSRGAPAVENDPNDPGGTTFCGIDQRDHPDVHVAQLTIEGVKEIYRAIEWTKGKCASLKPPWDLAVFDSAVNPGLGFIGTAIQKAVNGSRPGALTVDGVIGPKTIVAVNDAALDALERFLNLRGAYYHALPDYKNGKPFKIRFIDGWMNRLNDLRKACGL